MVHLKRLSEAIHLVSGLRRKTRVLEASPPRPEAGTWNRKWWPLKVYGKCRGAVGTERLHRAQTILQIV